MMIGWSGSPSRKSTITSWPMRGIEIIAPVAARPGAATRGSSRSCSRRACPCGPSGTGPSPGRTCRSRSPRRRPHDDRGLRSLVERLGRRAQWAERDRRSAAQFSVNWNRVPPSPAAVIGIVAPEIVRPRAIRYSRFWSARGQLIKSEEIARRDAARIRLPAASDLLRRLQLLEPHFAYRTRRPISPCSRPANRRSGARIRVGEGVQIARLLQVRTRLLEIEVVRHEARPDSTSLAIRSSFARVPRRRKVADPAGCTVSGVAGQRLMRADESARTSFELPHAVLEEVVDALVLHQPADEIEDRSPDTARSNPRSGRHRPDASPRGTDTCAKTSARIVGAVHLLEDPAIRLARHVPDPRPQRCLVAQVVARAARGR